MITRSLFHLRPRLSLPAGGRRSPVVGPRHKGAFPACGRARRPDPSCARAVSFGGEQVERATQASNYWSATTNAGNPNNARNVNFNNGNVNNNNKTNNNYVRAVRSGS
jgi:hypothetical protein